MRLSQLPLDIINSLILLVDIKSVLRLGQTSKEWQTIVNSEDCWRKICKNVSGSADLELSSAITWRNYYIQFLSWDWSNPDQISRYIFAHNSNRGIHRPNYEGMNPSARTVLFFN